MGAARGRADCRHLPVSRRHQTSQGAGAVGITTEEAGEPLRAYEDDVLGLALEVADAFDEAIVFARGLVEHHTGPVARRELSLAEELDVVGPGTIEPYPVANYDIIYDFGVECTIPLRPVIPPTESEDAWESGALTPETPLLRGEGLGDEGPSPGSEISVVRRRSLLGCRVYPWVVVPLMGQVLCHHQILES